MAHRHLLSAEAQEMLTAQIMPCRDATRQLSKYGDRFLSYVDAETSRIHSHLNIAGAPTGRMSSSDPNLQSIPRDPRFRGLFAAPAGRLLIAADYQLMELRVMAHLAGEPNLLDAFRRGVDVHRHTAGLILSKSTETVTANERQLAKAANFGLIFGQGPRGFREYAANNYQVRLSADEASSLHAAWFGHYPGIADYHRRAAELFYRDGYVTTPSGRRCRSDDGRVTVAYNAPTQGGAAEVMFATLARLDRALDDSGLDARLVLVVHDEVLVEASESDAEQVRAIVETAMSEGMLSIFPDATTDRLVDSRICRSWAKA
jgi:DNA polymerase I-like protein with 3'-5' exonuclease and polymerase domains